MKYCTAGLGTDGLRAWSPPHVLAMEIIKIFLQTMRLSKKQYAYSARARLKLSKNRLE